MDERVVQATDSSNALCEEPFVSQFCGVAPVSGPKYCHGPNM